MSNKASISKKDERLLHTKSGNRCALCRILLVEPNTSSAVCIGENAHIYGEKPDAARFDPHQSEKFVNSEANLIFLCRNCHKRIDTDVDSYPPALLFEIKNKHEQWVEQSLQEQSVAFSFAELEVLAKYLISNDSTGGLPTSYSLLKIDEKIKKNELQSMQKYITMGMSNNSTIEEYLNRHPDPSFSVQLTNIMANKYRELKALGLDSCEIFSELWNFASGNHTDFTYQAAGLGILAYFFEQCEVFEK